MERALIAGTVLLVLVAAPREIILCHIVERIINMTSEFRLGLQKQLYYFSNLLPLWGIPALSWSQSERSLSSLAIWPEGLLLCTSVRIAAPYPSEGPLPWLMPDFRVCLPTAELVRVVCQSTRLDNFDAIHSPGTDDRSEPPLRSPDTEGPNMAIGAAPTRSN